MFSSPSFKLKDYKLMNDHKLSNAINYLKKLDTKALIDDKLAYEAIFLVASLVWSEIKTILSLKCSKLFADVLLELYNVSARIDFDNFNIDTENQSKKMSKNDQRVSMIAFVLQIVNCLTTNVAFRITFAANNGLRAHLAFLNKESLNRLLNVNLSLFHELQVRMAY